MRTTIRPNDGRRISTKNFPSEKICISNFECTLQSARSNLHSRQNHQANSLPLALVLRNPRCFGTNEAPLDCVGRKLHESVGCRYGLRANTQRKDLHKTPKLEQNFFATSKIAHKRVHPASSSKSKTCTPADLAQTCGVDVKYSIIARSRSTPIPRTLHKSSKGTHKDTQEFGKHKNSHNKNQEKHVLLRGNSANKCLGASQGTPILPPTVRDKTWPTAALASSLRTP